MIMCIVVKTNESNCEIGNQNIDDNAHLPFRFCFLSERNQKESKNELFLNNVQ
jgi:hypothetical protein